MADKQLSPAQLKTIRDTLNQQIQKTSNLIPGSNAVKQLTSLVIGKLAPQISVLSFVISALNSFFQSLFEQQKRSAEDVASHLKQMRDAFTNLPPCMEKGKPTGNYSIDDELIQWFNVNVDIVSQQAAEVANPGGGEDIFSFINGFLSLPADVISVIATAIQNAITESKTASVGDVARSIEVDLQKIKKLLAGLKACGNTPAPPKELPKPPKPPSPAPSSTTYTTPPPTTKPPTSTTTSTTTTTKPPTPPPKPTECSNLLDAIRTLIEALKNIKSGEGGNYDLTPVLKRQDELEELIRNLAENVAEMRTEAQQNSRRSDNFARKILTAIFDGRREAQQNSRRGDTLSRQIIQICQAGIQQIIDKVDNSTKAVLLAITGVSLIIGGIYAAIAASFVALSAEIQAFQAAALSILTGIGTALATVATILAQILGLCIAIERTLLGFIPRLLSIDSKVTTIRDIVDRIRDILTKPFSGNIRAIDWKPKKGAKPANDDDDDFMIRHEASLNPKVPEAKGATNIYSAEDVELVNVNIPIRGNDLQSFIYSGFQGIAEQLRIMTADLKDAAERGNTDDCFISLPEIQMVKRETDCPQMQFYYYGLSADGKIDRRLTAKVTIMMWDFKRLGFPKKPPVPQFKRGSINGQMVLYKVKENSKGDEIKENFTLITVNCDNEGEVKRVLNAFRPFVNPEYKSGTIATTTYDGFDRKGQPLEQLKSFTAICWKAEWFEGGLTDRLVGGAAKMRDLTESYVYIPGRQKTAINQFQGIINEDNKKKFKRLSSKFEKDYLD